MKKVVLMLVVFVLVALISWLYLYNGIGCYKSMVIAGQNSRNIVKLKPGITKNEVLKIMGPPNKIEVYPLGNRIYEFMFYRTKPFDVLFKDRDVNFSSVCVDSSSGVVLSLDRKFYDEILSARRK